MIATKTLRWVKALKVKVTANYHWICPVTRAMYAKYKSTNKYRCLWNTNAPPSPTWPLTLTFDLLTWKSIGIIYSSRTIYLPSLKLLGQSVLELSVAQGSGLPTYRPTDRPTYRPTGATQYAPPFSKGGHNNSTIHTSVYIDKWSMLIMMGEWMTRS